MPRVARKIWDYLPGYRRERWDEWRGDWCWIQDKEAPEFCEARKVCVEGVKDWSLRGLTEDRLHPVINRITRLATVGLTIEHVGVDFLLHHISSLQERDRPAWLYGGAADRMRLLPGLANNLSVYGHAWLCDQLFGRFALFKLPTTIIPLNINSARDQILKWMPDCNVEGVSSTWQLPTLDKEL